MPKPRQHTILAFLAATALCSLGQAGLTPQNAANAADPPAKFASAGAEVPSSSSEEQAFVDWAREHAIRLSTVQPGHGFDDLLPLKSVIGDARIVALGEATHGTSEFFELKHRMIEFLASQMNFTIFSIEANMPEAYRLNDFVVHGNGDPRQLLKGMYFWTWDTQEVLDMVLWMREFNKSGKGHIEFTGFDMQTPTGSIETVRSFVAAHDAAYLPQVELAYTDVAKIFHSDNGRASFGVASAKFPVEIAAGKRITFSGYIQTKDVTQGWAGLWWRVDGKPGSPPLAFDNMQNGGARGTSPWTRYEISIDVPADAQGIYFGVLHAGDGEAWFDSLKIAIDGVPYNFKNFDPDFESDSPGGLHLGGDGYQLALDLTVAHTGKQSLHSRYMGQSPDEDQVASACKEVLKHLAANRDRYLHVSDAKTVDWTIQNARLVLQYMQSKAGGKSRDESMAENIKWIADQNPGAKIVVWAHNGHVSYSEFMNNQPMGDYLHRLFGDQLLNFGFAFDRGSFRAVEAGKGLHTFSVSAAPPGTFDRALADTGIPLFALDLRQAPKNGPVAQWLAQPRPARSIGAVYDEPGEANYFFNMRAQEDFDVILFVDKTSAAHANP